MIKNAVCTATGVVVTFLASLFGGWDLNTSTLIAFMVIDYITGLTVGFMNRSTKTASGGLNSYIGFKGLCKKFMILVMVVVAVRVDLMLGTNYIRNVVVIGYIVNELISITENSALLGLPVPTVIVRAIDVLKQKEGNVNE